MDSKVIEIKPNDVETKLDNINESLKDIVRVIDAQTAQTERILKIANDMIIFDNTNSKITLRISEISSLNVHIDNGHPDEPKTDIIMKNGTRWIIKEPIDSVIDKIQRYYDNISK